MLIAHKYGKFLYVGVSPSKLREDLYLKTKRYLLLAISLAAFLLAGCGESKELKTFRSDFETFCSNVAEIDASINNLDANAEDAPSQLLTLLDQLDAEFKGLAALKIPSQFSYMENLATEASENMTLAVENYHTAYEAENFDTSAASIAAQYYERAYKRVQYMITFMHGEVPEDENIQMIEE